MSGKIQIPEERMRCGVRHRTGAVRIPEEGAILQWAERWLAPQSHGSVKKCFAAGVEEARAAASTPTKVARQREKNPRGYF